MLLLGIFALVGVLYQFKVAMDEVAYWDSRITAMDRQQLLKAVRAWIESGKPFLGICVGYQARGGQRKSCAETIQSSSISRTAAESD